MNAKTQIQNQADAGSSPQRSTSNRRPLILQSTWLNFVQSLTPLQIMALDNLLSSEKVSQRILDDINAAEGHDHAA